MDMCVSIAQAQTFLGKCLPNRDKALLITPLRILRAGVMRHRQVVLAHSPQATTDQKMVTVLLTPRRACR
jgi:hypothetical protein